MKLKDKVFIGISVVATAFPLLVDGKTGVKGVYYRELFGHIYHRPSRSSDSLASIRCGHPLKIRPEKTGEGNNSREKWSHVKSGGYEGYVVKSLLSREAHVCFQRKYPKFMDMLKLSALERYYWGRLYGKYIEVKK